MSTKLEPKLIIEYTDPEAERMGLCKAYDGDAGIDLRVILKEEDREKGFTIFPGDKVFFTAGFKMQLPEGYWAEITHRSSTEYKLRLRVISATIDQGYRGHIYTQVQNSNTYPLVVHHGDRLSQMILHKIVSPKIEVGTVSNDSSRGSNGFGSSDTKMK